MKFDKGSVVESFVPVSDFPSFLALLVSVTLGSLREGKRERGTETKTEKDRKEERKIE